MRSIIAVLLLFIATSVWANGSVDRLPPEQVDRLNIVQEKLDAVSDAVVACMVNGKKHKVCLCANEEIVLDFNLTVKKLFIDHPELKTYDLVKFSTPEGEWVNQSLKTIHKQAKKDPVCK